MPDEVNLDRRTLLAMAAAAAVAAPQVTQAQSVALRPNLPGPYDLVLAGGRVIDPESGLDAVRDVGIAAGRIAAISELPLEGTVRLEAGDQIVAPGFENGCICCSLAGCSDFCSRSVVPVDFQ